MMSNIKKLLNDLTLKEKILLLSGFDAWHTNKVERLDIPSIKMSDSQRRKRQWQLWKVIRLLSQCYFSWIDMEYGFNKSFRS